MTPLDVARDQLRAAQQRELSGNYLDAARLFLAALLFVMECRGAKRDELALRAHAWAVACAKRVIDSSDGDEDRAEADAVLAACNRALVSNKVLQNDFCLLL